MVRRERSCCARPWESWRRRCRRRRWTFPWRGRKSPSTPACGGSAASELDLFLLHAPRIDLVATDEWLGWLTSLAEQGRIGAFGLAVTRVDDALDFLDRAPALAPVIQCPDSLGAREADALVARGRAPQLTYGYIAAARRRAPRSDVPEILKQALRRNPFGALVVSTLRRERLRLFAEAADQIPDQAPNPDQSPIRRLE